MNEISSRERLSPSVFYAESTVHCTLQEAWNMMLDYKAWNPDFVQSETTLVRGDPQMEGELTLVNVLDEKRAPVGQFYAETIKVVAPHHMVWYVFPVAGEEFRNFVDFWLEEVGSGVRFRIYYYAQNAVPVEALAQLRSNMDESLRSLTVAFKIYCESKSSVSMSAM
jgi:hypothetical protein